MGVHTVGIAALQLNPISGAQVALQPSPLVALPSSQVSAPVTAPSPQRESTQTEPVQMLLEQSASTPQALPKLQLGHVPPPQSTSVSAPFFAVSEQVGT